MSRCFPYPPPGYTLSKASNDALIESIKLQNEREKSRAEKKEKKKAKKEKKVKEEKNKGKQEISQRVVDSNISHEPYGIFQKVGKEEMELLERSGITEELGLPRNSQDPSNSSDSTQNSNKNSNKRKRNESPVNVSSTGGNILRFRLPPQKKVDNKASREVEVQRPSGGVDLPTKNDNAGTSRTPSNKLPSVSLPSKPATVQLPPVESNRVQLNKPSVSVPTNSATVQPLGDTRKVHLKPRPPVPMQTNSATVQSHIVQLKTHPSVSTQTCSTTVQSLPGASANAQFNKLASASMPSNIDKADKHTILSMPPNSASVPNSSSVQLFPGEPSKAQVLAPSQSAFQQGGEPQVKHDDDHVSKKSKTQSKAEKKAEKKAKKYAKIIDRIPLIPTNETMDCDDDWLCGRKNPPETDLCVQTHKQMSCASSLLWPRAQYLHDTDLYALPYTIPF